MTLPSPGTLSATSKGSSPVRTAVSRRCQVGSRGREQGVVEPAVLGAELLPTGSVGRRVAGEHRRDLWVLHLERVRRDHPDPRHTRERYRREPGDVVRHDQVWTDLLPNPHQALVGVLSPGHELRPDRHGHGLELYDRWLPELRRCDPDELGPSLADVLFVLRGRGHAHQHFLEATPIELAFE